jgi:hypothetical protein
MLGKPTASLSSGLLARKGHARPAMRPQGFNPLMPGTHEDLGWNDMGHEMPEPAPYPQPVAYEPPADDAPTPPVLRQRAELEEQIAPQTNAFEPEPAPVPVEYEPESAPVPVAYEPEPELAPEPEPVVARAPAPKPAAAPRPVSPGTIARVARQTSGKKAKAAFTLRLDHDRHLRLRLASAVSNLSAQQLVTEALDAFLDSLPDVDALARRLAAGEGSGE